MADTSLPFGTRIWFAWACFFRVLFDGAFAARAFAARSPELPAPEPEPEPAPKPARAPEKREVQSALQLLALFQREGRFIDFLEQDITSFADTDVGVAARLVHEGCGKALRGHATIEPIRKEEEGAILTLDKGFSPAEVKLTGDVRGEAPYKGVLRHHGWRATKIELPEALDGHDGRVLAPAELEL